MFYAFMFLIILGYILNNISKKYSLNKVYYKRELSSNHVEVGEEFRISTILENKKLLPVTFLQVTEKFPSAIEYKFNADNFSSVDFVYHKTSLMILSYQRVKREYIVKFNDRGRYLLSDVTLTSGDFLGLNTTDKQLEYNEQIIVYPKPLDIDNELTQVGDFIGDISVKRWIIDDPLVTASIREYTGFEPQNAIHWPSSLKTGRLMVRNFDYTSDNSIFIILNIECFKPFWIGIDKDNIEKCYSITRKLIDELETEHIKYGFTTNAQIGDYFNGQNYLLPSLGQDHYKNILDSLACANYATSIPFEELISNILSWHINCKTYLIITPVILEPYIELINEIGNNVDKTMIISINSNNIDKINDSIIKYIERKEA